VEVVNDLNGELVNLYRVVQNHLEEFIRQFKRALSSRQVFKWMQDANVDGTDIQRALHYLQQQAFGGKIDGQTWGTATTQPAVNLLRIEEQLSAHLRLSGVYVEHLTWSACLDRYDRPHTCSMRTRPTGRPRAMAWTSLGRVRTARRQDAAPRAK
jgi:DNA adenine methylase